MEEMFICDHCGEAHSAEDSASFDQRCSAVAAMMTRLWFAVTVVNHSGEMITLETVSIPCARDAMITITQTVPAVAASSITTMPIMMRRNRMNILIAVTAIPTERAVSSIAIPISLNLSFTGMGPGITELSWR